jgi:hypothetical protein
VTRRAHPRKKIANRAALKAMLRQRAAYQHAKISAIGRDPLFDNGRDDRRMSRHAEWVKASKAYDQKNSGARS